MMRKNNSGITLISLVITIILLLILATIGISSGISTVRSSRLTKFTTEMKLMQQKVNELYDSYTNNRTVNLAGNEYTGTDIANIGNDISDVSEEQRNEVFSSSGSGITDTNGYMYYNVSIIDGLGIDGVDGEFFVNVAKRSVISVDGFEYEGNKYYTLEQLPEGLYNVEYNPQQVEGGPTFDVDYEKIGNDKYEISISNIQYEGYINKWYAKYKEEQDENWKTSENLNFTVDQMGTYQIKLYNGDIETTDEKVKTIKVTDSYVEDGMVLYLDGINNTGEGDSKHSTSTTVWKDLSGNGNDAILQNISQGDEESGWGANCLQLDGINDYAKIADSETMKPIDQTIEIVVNRTGEAPGNKDASKRGIIFVRWYGYTVELNKIENNAFTVSYGRADGGYLKSNEKLNLNKTYHIGATYEKKLQKIYFNSNYENEKKVEPMGYGGTMNETWIGNYNNATFTKANVYAIRMYNRALTEEELQHNYNIDKVRYNIE